MSHQLSAVTTRGAALALGAVLTWSALLTGLSGWAFWQRQWEQPACELTYMYPAFNKVESPLLATHTGYTLMEYSDYSNKPGKGDVVAPALFVPGNAGTYHQVRSLASETARLWAAQKQGAFADAPVRRVYLQWFAVDTNEALGAFDGRLLEQQTEFVVSSLQYLVQRYNITPAAHPGVLLVGHSMGGVVARVAMRQAATTPGLGPACISLLLTLASPHQAPPLPSHPSLSRFYSMHRGSVTYSKLGGFHSMHPNGTTYSKLGGQTNRSAPGAPAVLFVSVGGGFNDTQVSHGLTDPTGLHPPALTLHIPTDQVPGAWLAPTHASIMWCNQLVKPLARFLLGATREAVYALRDGMTGPTKTPQPTTTSTPRDPLSAAEAPSVPLAPPTYDHAALFLRHARQQLLGSYLAPWLESHFSAGDLTPHMEYRDGPLPKQKDRHSTHSKGPTLQQLLSRAESIAEVAGAPFGGAGGQACTGPNLLWYSQYVQPLEMSHQPSLVTSVTGNSKSTKGRSSSQSGGMSSGSSSSGGGGSTAGFTLVLQGRKHAQQVSKGVGHLYLWRLNSTTTTTVQSPVHQSTPPASDSPSRPAAAAAAAAPGMTFTLRASGIKPCQGFRVWVHPAAKGVTKKAGGLSEEQIREIDPEAFGGKDSEGDERGGTTGSTGEAHGGTDGADTSGGTGQVDVSSSTSSSAGTCSSDGSRASTSSDTRSNSKSSRSDTSASSYTSDSSTSSSSTQSVQNQYRSFTELVGNSIEVTHLAAWLPPAVPEGRRAVRNWTLVDEVIAGLDWAANSSWSLTLPSSALEGVEAVTIWAGTASSPPAFHLAAALTSHWEASDPLSTAKAATTASNTRNSAIQSPPPVAPLQLGIRNLLFPAVISALGPASVPLVVDFSVASRFWSSQSSSDGSAATVATETSTEPGAAVGHLIHQWRGLTQAATRVTQHLIRAGIHALGLPKLLHLRVQAVESGTTSDTSKSSTGAVHGKLCRLHTALVASPNSSHSSHTSGDTGHSPLTLPHIASNLTSYPLSHCFSHQPTQPVTLLHSTSPASPFTPFAANKTENVLQEGGGACTAVLLRDPTCSYQVSLSLTLGTPALLDFLLGHLGAIWLVMQALLLLCCAAALDLPSSSPPQPQLSSKGATAINTKQDASTGGSNATAPNTQRDASPPGDNQLANTSCQEPAGFLPLLGNECSRILTSLTSPATWAAVITWALLNLLNVWVTAHVLTHSSSGSDNTAGVAVTDLTAAGGAPCSASAAAGSGGPCDLDSDDTLLHSNNGHSVTYVSTHSFFSLVCLLWLTSLCISQHQRKQQIEACQNQSNAAGSFIRKYWSNTAVLAPWASVLSVLQTLPVLLSVLPPAVQKVSSHLQSNPRLRDVSAWVQTALLPSDSIVTMDVRVAGIELLLVVIPAAVTLLAVAHVTLLLLITPLRATKAAVGKIRQRSSATGDRTSSHSKQAAASNGNTPQQRGKANKQHSSSQNMISMQAASVAGCFLLLAALSIHPAFAVALAALYAIVCSYGSSSGSSSSSSSPAALQHQAVSDTLEKDSTDGTDARQHSATALAALQHSPTAAFMTRAAFQQAWALLLLGAAAVSVPGGIAWVVHLAKPIQAVIRPVPTVTPEDAQRVLRGLKPLSLPPPPGFVGSVTQAAQLVKGVARAAVSHLAHSPASVCDTLVMATLPLSVLAFKAASTRPASKAGSGSRSRRRFNHAAAGSCSTAAALRSIAAGMLMLAVLDPGSGVTHLLQSVAAIVVMRLAVSKQ